MILHYSARLRSPHPHPPISAGGAIALGGRELCVVEAIVLARHSVKLHGCNGMGRATEHWEAQTVSHQGDVGGSWEQQRCVQRRHAAAGLHMAARLRHVHAPAP